MSLGLTTIAESTVIQMQTALESIKDNTLLKFRCGYEAHLISHGSANVRIRLPFLQDITASSCPIGLHVFGYNFRRDIGTVPDCVRSTSHLTELSEKLSKEF